MWKAWGDLGMTIRVENSWNNAEFLLQQIKLRDNRFKLVIDEIEGPNVCFWWVPPDLRKSKDTPELRKNLAIYVPQIKVKLQKSGRIMLDCCPSVDQPTFFRTVQVNRDVSNQDITYLLDQVEQIGESLLVHR